jgi:hypothetical protein
VSFKICSRKFCDFVAAESANDCSLHFAVKTTVTGI